MKVVSLFVFLIFLVKAHPGCTRPTIGKRAEYLEALEKQIRTQVLNGDQLVWGTIDSVKSLVMPKELYYEGYNIGKENEMIRLSEAINRRNPYLSPFRTHYVWHATVKTKGFVYKVQIGETDSECSYHHLVSVGHDVPFLQSSNGSLKVIEYFYHFGGYQMVPGKEVFGKIGLKAIWPDAPNLDSLK